jgi:hypothetical protein
METVPSCHEVTNRVHSIAMLNKEAAGIVNSKLKAKTIDLVPLRKIPSIER